MTAPRFLPLALTVCLGATLVVTPTVCAQSAPPPPSASPAASTPAPEPSSVAMSLEEAISLALANNFDIKIQQVTNKSALENLIAAKSDYDPSFVVSTRHNLNQAVNASSTLEGAAGPRAEGATVNASVSQKITTGANVSLSSALFNSSRTNSRFSTFNPQYSSDLSLSLSQPLLRGRGKAYNKAAIQRSQIGVNRSNLDYKGRVLDTIQSVENAYANLVSAREQRDVRRFSLQLAKNLHEENKIKRTTGIATDLDVLTAEVGVANAQNGVLLSEQTVRDREDALRNLLGSGQFDVGIVPAAMADPPKTVPTVDRSYQLALANQTDYQSNLANIKQLELDVLTTKSGRLPSLNLDGSLAYSGREADLGGAWDLVTKRGSYNWALGLTLRFPWGLHAENSRYRIALNNLSSAKLRSQQLERTMLVQVRSAVRSVQTNVESVRISELSSQLSQKKYDLEKARYDAGLSTARRVLEAQSDLETARLSQLQAKVGLRTALNALERLEGAAIERFRVPLPEDIAN
jgi:outer membrane protein TolC